MNRVFHLFLLPVPTLGMHRTRRSPWCVCPSTWNHETLLNLIRIFLIKLCHLRFFTLRLLFLAVLMGSGTPLGRFLEMALYICQCSTWLNEWRLSWRKHLKLLSTMHTGEHIDHIYSIHSSLYILSSLSSVHSVEALQASRPLKLIPDWKTCFHEIRIRLLEKGLRALEDFWL